MGTETAHPQLEHKREEHPSTDGKWRSFPKVPNLLQYVNGGVYFGRNKINNKVIRKSLQTAVWSTAKLRLVAFLKENRETQERAVSSRDVPKHTFHAHSFHLLQTALQKPGFQALAAGNHAPLGAQG